MPKYTKNTIRGEKESDQRHNSLFETPVAPQATDIGRRESGRFDRRHTEPDSSTEPIARDQQTGRFQLDPFDITPGYEGAPPAKEFDRTATVGVTPATGGDGFRIQTADDTVDRTLGRGSEVVERADQQIGLPDAGELDSTDVVAEAEIGLRDRESGWGHDAEIIETRETDDTIFNFR